MAIYYIDSAVGSNSNSGSIGSPWLTIQHALDNAVGAEQHTFVLIGSFTISTALVFTDYINTVTSAELPNRYPVFDGGGTATLTLSVANAISQIARLQNLNIVNTLTFFAGSALNAASSRAIMINNCTVTGPLNNWLRVVAYNSTITNARVQTAYDCTLIDTVGTLPAPITDSGLYARCSINTVVSTSNGFAARYTQMFNCSVFAPNLTTGRLFSVDQFGPASRFISCAFHINSGNVITALSGHTLPEFQNCKVFGGGFCASPIFDLGGNSVLSGAPFADPANFDFTPSAELIASAVSGVTPGIIQSIASTGTTGFTGIEGVSRSLGS
jgi:hypothetical protein